MGKKTDFLPFVSKTANKNNNKKNASFIFHAMASLFKLMFKLDANQSVLLHKESVLFIIIYVRCHVDEKKKKKKTNYTCMSALESYLNTYQYDEYTY